MSESSSERCGYVWPEDSERVVFSDREHCCFRRTVPDADRCAWHTDPEDTEHKTIPELRKVRAPPDSRDLNEPVLELLDGSNLSGVEIGESLSLKGVSLQGSDLTNTNLRRTKLAQADLRKAEITDAVLQGAKLSESDLRNATLSNAILDLAELTDADARYVDLSNASLSAAILPNAYLLDADLYEADLYRAELTDASLRGAELTDAYLFKADLTDADLYRTDLSRAILERATLKRSDLKKADLGGAELEEADLRKADLEDSVLEDADLRGADFTDALLYQADLTNARINAATDFGRDGSVEETIYERQPDLDGWFTETTESNYLAGAWVHRRLERLHEENALSEDAREFHVRKQEAELSHYWQGFRDSPIGSAKLQNLGRSVVLLSNRYLTRHGESLQRILAISAGVVLMSTLLYPVPWGGGITSGVDQLTFQWSLERGLSGNIPVLLRSLYFSVITFSTIGYGDHYPDGPLSRLLVGFESLSGAILIALFIFVLGRRTAR